MSIARDEFAARLNGREYTEEITGANEAAEARSSRLLIVFGGSDDLTEFRGIINDEIGAYEGADHKIIRDFDGWAVAIDDEQCERCSARLKNMPGIEIKAEWCPEGFEGSWRISTSVPHATFEVMEDGALFCRGIVIDEADLCPTPATDRREG